MFDDIEYVDPAKSKCEECSCSFGVHLKTCSKFTDPRANQRKISKAEAVLPQSVSDLMASKIRVRIKWQREKMAETNQLYGTNSRQSNRLGAYIGALEWVLRESGHPLESNRIVDAG